MSPSSGSNASTMQFYCFPLIAISTLIFTRLVHAECCHEQDQRYIDASFSSRQTFATTPVEGISLLSESMLSTDSFLIDGVTEDLSYNFVFMPPSGSAPSEYTLSYSCDNDLVYTPSSCSLVSLEAAIDGSDATAYNTTVTCAFSKFPGTTLCQLTATKTANVLTAAAAATATTTPGTTVPTANVTASVSPSASISTVTSRWVLPHRGFDTLNSSIRQASTYSSDIITCNVFGIVFYLADSFGKLSSSATVVSGTGNSYKLSNYDRSDAGIREILTYGMVPGDSSLLGSSGISLFNSTTVTTEVGDHIFQYDSTCSITDAQLSGGSFSFSDAEKCALGVAVEDENSYPTLGVQFRIYKSGNISVLMKWSSLGSSTETYDQTLVFEISEDAPPVITSIDQLALYRSTPCDSEVLTLTGYNIQSAVWREVVVTNDDGSNTTWSEITSLFSHDFSADLSTSVFESAGGSGTGVGFILNCTFDSDFRSNVVLDSSLSFVLSFSSPPNLTSIAPTSLAVAGGETIVLTGDFSGFDGDDFIYIGGYEIAGSDVSLSGTTQISLSSPALANVGEQYVYDVVVAVCAEKSNPLSLAYIVAPNAAITSSGSSPNDAGIYVLESTGTATFVVEVSGNNEGVTFDWGIFFANNTEVSLSDATTNQQIFTISPDMLPDSSETYEVQINVTNSLDLSSSAEVQIEVASEGEEVISVNVYKVEDLSLSVDAVTLVQSSVTTSSDSEVSLEWTYDNSSYPVSGSSVLTQETLNESTTGPTKLGLEFNIAREHLRIGTTRLNLFASLVSNPNVKASNGIDILVVPSLLEAVINNGVNGSVIEAGNDFNVSAANSRDPDVLDGDSSNGISYLWTKCLKSLDLSFETGVQNCTSLLPTDNATQQFTIPAASLTAGLLDNATNSEPTYFLFGIQVSKQTKVTESFSYFGVRMIGESERLPTLSTINIVDSKGTILGNTELSHFADIIIQPSASETIVRWAFDMKLLHQKHLFAESGVLKMGSGFVSQRGEESRLSLGFAAGRLNPATLYTVLITVSAIDSSLKTEQEVTFRTAEAPTLNCTAPSRQEALITEKKLAVSASLTFGTQKIEYCFFLVSETRQRFPVGLGCSTVPFAKFSFAREGEYVVECLAKTVSGAVVSNLTLDSIVVVSTPAPVANSSIITALTERVGNLSAEVNRCQTLRDHACLSSLILGGNEIALQVENVTASDNSDAANALLEVCKAYIADLSAVSSSLAAATIYRPNQIEDSIDQSFLLSHVPGTMVDETTLYDALQQVDSAVSSTELNTTVPVRSDNIVDKVTGIANLSITTAHTLDTAGTTRRRLLQDTSSRAAYADLLFRTLNWVAQIRAQQEGCGFQGRQTTNYPGSYNEAIKRSTSSRTLLLLPSEIDVLVACDQNQVSVKMGEMVQGQVCSEALPAGSTSQRLVVVMIAMPDYNLEETQMIKGIQIYTSASVYVRLTGIESLSENCLEVSLERKRESLVTTEHDNLTYGVLEQLTSDSPARCTRDTCYILKASTTGVATFTSQQVRISTSDQGLLVAGNITRAIDPRPINLVEGVGFGMNGSITRVAGLFAVFAAIAGLITWVAVTRFMIALPDVDEMGWEYVERDMFGRGTVESSVFAPSTMSSLPGEPAIGSAFTALSQRKSMEMERKASTGMLG